MYWLACTVVRTFLGYGYISRTVCHTHKRTVTRHSGNCLLYDCGVSAMEFVMSGLSVRIVLFAGCCAEYTRELEDKVDVGI